MGPGWEMTLGGFVWMAVWIVALVVMVWFITRSPDTDRSAATEPGEILRARFARGEINQAEYEQACRVLDTEKEQRKR
jgi:uncharacterized membrane protein